MDHETERVPAAHLRPTNLGLVFVGGTAGVLAREALILALPDIGRFPIAVFLANLVGALLLGWLLTALVARRASSRLRTMQLLLGTGLLGGFTTYSALAQVVSLLLADGEVAAAAAYGIGTVLLGGLATWVGMAIGGLFSPHSVFSGEEGREDG